MVYPRKLLPTLQKQMEKDEIVVLTGMRRVGKTILARMIFDALPSTNKAFFDIENPLEQKIFEETDYNNILANLRPFGIDPDKPVYLFLDEIQAMPEIVRVIKYLYDHHQVKFFLTGSSSFYLKNLFPESLSGRKTIFELFPLDFEEFLIFKGYQKKFTSSFINKAAHKNAISYEKSIKLYDEYLLFGGFPKVVLESDYEQKKRILNDILKSYFEKDVKILFDIKDIAVFRDMLLLLMQRIGSKLEIAKLASELGISRQTVYSYLGFLESTYVFFLISPFSRSVDREVSGTKKIYFCDTGLLNQCARVSEGNVFENAVFLNIRSHGGIHYYEKRGSVEIDFILNQSIAVEAKVRGTPYHVRDLKKITSFLELPEYYLITKKSFDDPHAFPATEL